jgi:hypothetical protein
MITLLIRVGMHTSKVRLYKGSTIREKMYNHSNSCPFSPL